MNKLFLGAIIAIMGFGLWYFSGNKPSLKPGTIPFTTTQGTTPSSTETQLPTEITIQLNEENNSGELGTATLKDTEGKVMVALNLTGAPKGVAQPAHIHEGSCPGVGAVKYPLTSASDGRSETTLNISLEKLLSQLPLAVNVHKSASQAGVYIACGNLIAK